jgi:hypothetical protein
MQVDAEIPQKISQGSCSKTSSRGFFAKAASPCFHTFISTSLVHFILELLALKMNGAYTVPDPELTLLDSNLIEQDKLQLLFRPKYVVSTHFIHVHVPFNFSQLLVTPQKIFEQYHNLIEQWPEPF